MSCIHIKDQHGNPGILCVGGPDLLIDAGGKTFRFEFHDYCGPMLVSKSGEILKRQPGERSPFWLAVNAWCRQGKRVVGGKCVWDMPKPTKVVHLGGKNYEVVEAGDAWYDGFQVIGQAEAEAIRAAAVPGNG